MSGITLSDEQRRELRVAIGSAGNVRHYRRLKVVELADRGYDLGELGVIFGISEHSARNYLRAYRLGGVEALQDAPRSGRPRKLPLEYDGSPEAHANWQRLLDKSPATIPKLRLSLPRLDARITRSLQSLSPIRSRSRT